MEFTYEQRMRFDMTLQRMLEFTNANLGSCIYFVPPIATAEDVKRAGRIAFDLWESPKMIDSFLERYGNVPELPGVDHDTVREWRHALRGPFFIQKAAGNTAELLYDETIFEVHSMNRMWEDLVPYQPDLIYTTLIPFDGKIVCDGFVLHHESNVQGSGVQRLQRTRATARKKGIVTTAAEFKQVADRLMEKRRQGLLEPNAAAVWMNYIAQYNELCNDSCFPYEIPRCEIPRILQYTA